jgi:hypothetical protein
MSYLYLALALTLPWLNGCIWLKYFESFFTPSETSNHFRLAGYGFFAGYAALSCIIVFYSSLAGSVSFPAVMITLAVLTAAGALLLRQKSPPMRKQPMRSRTRPDFRTWGLMEWAMLILMAWTLLHLAFALQEIFYRPVYPWDAWLMWIYRAKAWFTQGAVFDFQGTAAWLSATAPAYTVNAIDYPVFASVVPFWVAVSLGYWSETLINLPVALAGLAIAAALYGQCRESGLGKGAALLSCYLLFSIPLFGTHLALAGYADIWMCGFAGLGFMSLLRGGISKKMVHTLVGLVMIALGIMVKNEGLVWFLGALLFLLILHLSWKTLIAAAVVGISLLVMILDYGIDPLMIPLLGELSVVDGRVTLPFISPFELELFNVWRPYGISFFLSGSWNLAWLALAACLAICLLAPKDRVNRVVAGFILVFLATQVLIFVFSSHGEFAVRYTAINRLPLHFLPSILYSIGVVLHQKLQSSSSSTPEPMAGAGHAA